MGIIYQATGDYPRSLSNYSKALDMAAEIGDRQMMAVAAINIGELYRSGGEYTRALACYQYGLGAAIELDDRMMVAVTCENIGQIYFEQSRYVDAESLLTKAIALTQALNTLYFLAAELYSRAETLTAQGSYTLAQHDNDQALRLAAQIERREIQLKAQLLALDLRVKLDQADRAAALGACAALLEQWSEADQQAAIYYQLWRLSERDDHHAQATEHYHALYARTPNEEYRQRIRDLTGAAPPNSPALPALPALIAQKSVNLDVLLDRVDTVIRR